MNIEEIVRAWKSADDELDTTLPESPVGEELSEAELEEVMGGLCTYLSTCFQPMTLHNK